MLKKLKINREYMLGTRAFTILFLFSKALFTRNVASQNLNLEKPEIWLSSYSEVDSYRTKPADEELRTKKTFQNNLVFKNGSDYIIYEETLYADFTCEAKYPITWKVPFPEQLKFVYILDLRHATVDTRTSVFTENDTEPISTRFTSVFSVRRDADRFFSVNFTCSATGFQTTPQSSIHVYMIGNHVIEYQGQTLHISLDASRETPFQTPPLVLPCRPSSPNLQIIIEKQKRITAVPGKNSTVETKWETINASSGYHFNYDPKIGFIFDELTTVRGTDLYGLYKCTVESSSGDDALPEIDTSGKYYVFANVTIPTKNPNSENIEISQEVVKFTPRSIAHGNAKVIRGYTMESEFSAPSFFIECCSGDAHHPPLMYSLPCNKPVECKLMEYIVEKFASKYSNKENWNNNNTDYQASGTDCITQRAYDASMIITCQAKQLDFVEHFFEVLHLLAEGSVVNRTERIRNANLNGGTQKKINGGTGQRLTSLKQYTDSVTVDTVGANQKMIIIIGRKLESLLGFAYLTRSYRYSYRSPHPNESDTDVKILDILERIFEYDRDVYYEGEPLDIICFGIEYFYAHGAHLRINWDNGTNTIINADWGPTENGRPIYLARHVYIDGMAELFDSGGHLSAFMFGNTTFAKKGMISAEYWLPQRSNDKWDKISKKIQIMPSVAPMFREEKDEVVYFFKGDVGKQLHCTVYNGLPLPSVKVTKDGWSLQLLSDERGSDNLINVTGWTMKGNKEKNEIFITIKLGVIDHEQHGFLRCIATNVNGTVTRTIHVVMLEKRNNFIIPLWFTVVAALCLVLSGLGFKYWRK